MAGDSTGSVAFVAVPFPAQGHLNQLLHLSLLLASRSRELSVHYAAPAVHVRQAQSRLHGWDATALGSIQFHELYVPAYDSPAPDPTATSSFPNHLIPMWEAFSTAAAAPLAALLRTLSSTHRRVVVVYDRMNSFAATEAARLGNGEAHALQCVAISYHLGYLDAGHRLLRDHGLEYVPLDVSMSRQFLEYMFRTTAEVQNEDGRGVASAVGLVMNTCRALEGEFIDAIAAHPTSEGLKHFAVGPLHLNPTASGSGEARHECVEWLDAQPTASVLYVSFGTTSTLRAEQVAEMAAALKGSRQRFIWVLRDADRADIFTKEIGGESEPHKLMMSEFTKDTEGTGLVITGWAPQLEILAHSATAAFMSHCGWNSTLESLSHGKPILAWPMHSDQPWDAELICKYLKVGFLVRPWEKHGELIPAKAIQEVIEEAMLSQNGMAVRERAKVLGEAVRASVAEGGSSSQDLDDFVAHITR